MSRQDAKRIVDSAKLLHVHSIIEVWDRGSDDKPALVKTIPDLDLLIRRVVVDENTTRIDRSLRHLSRDKSKWDAAAQAAKRIVLKLTCTPKTLPHLLDTHTTTTCFIGANRSTKTHTACMIAARQWMLRGGNGNLFLLTGPEHKHCNLLLSKLIKGDTRTPPVFPKELVHWYPKRHERDRTIYMIDGSEWKLLDAKEKKIESLSVEWALFTEAAQVSDVGVYGALRNRVVSTNGQVVIESKPKSIVGWLNTEIVQNAQRQADKQRQDPSYMPSTRVTHLSMQDNPWVSTAAIERAKADITNKMLVARALEGEFADEANRYWEAYWNKETKLRLTFPNPTFDIAELGLQDITRIVSGQLFAKQHDFLGGGDQNLSPMTTVVCKVGVPLGQMDITNPKHWVLVCLDCVWTRGLDVRDHARKLKSFRGGQYKGMGLVIDANSCHTYGDSRVRVSHRGEDFEREGFEIRPPGRTQKEYKPTNGNRSDGFGTLKLLMAEERLRVCDADRCSTLIYSFEHQWDSGDANYGPIGSKTHPGSRQDAWASPVDALRYLAYAIFFERRESSTIGQPLFIDV